MSFTANRELLNPKFEGYKLSHLSDHSVKRYGLTHFPSQTAISGRTRTPLSFEEVQSRITHNHLAVQAENNFALYVDEHLRIIAISINPKSFDPSIRVLLELPRPISDTKSNVDVHNDYPSVLNVKEDFWLVSDGFGQLYTLEMKAGNATITGSYGLPTDSDIGNPFRIQNARIVSDHTVACLLSYSLRQMKPSFSRDKRTVFRIVLVTLPIQGGQDHLQDLNVIWRYQGDEAPVYSFYDSKHSSFCLLGSSVYTNIEATHPNQPLEYEVTPISRTNESAIDRSLEIPPYSWTQTSDAVTVAFPIPSYIQKAAFRITLTTSTLTLHISSEMQHPIPLPHYSLKLLWDKITPSSSFWTWDKEGEQKYGLLTIHLEKQHEGTRWSQVFARSSDTSDSSDIEVLEILDPSELWSIRESLEKYTGALSNGEDASGLGLGKGVPSLAEGELDDEIDASVGREVRFTLINDAGASQNDNTINSENAPFFLLSTPLPGITENLSLVIKHNIDGLFFTPNIAENVPFPENWAHTATFSALAFVLASKRDIRFTFHVTSEAVFAFESGINVGGGNVYIYRNAKEKNLWAQQSVVKIANDGTGALLGLGAIGTGKNYTILCLCERELVVIRNII